MPVDFSAVLASMRLQAGALSVVVPPDWLQGRTVFGGMQVALAVRAMRLIMPEAERALPLRAAQATFVGPLVGDTPIHASPQILRTGRSTTHARCDLLHDAAVACSVVAIFGAPRVSQFVREMPRPDPGLTFAQCPQPSVYKTIAAPVFLNHFEMRWARGGPPFSGQAEPRSMIYARLRDTESEPEHALIALADSIPTPVLSMLTQPKPASSLNWMIEVLRDPARLDLHQPVLIDTEVRAGTDGYLSQTSILYGADGHAYSVSHQTVGVFA
jgi:acyl-CoA thioesterase